MPHHGRRGIEREEHAKPEPRPRAHVAAPRGFEGQRQRKQHFSGLPVSSVTAEPDLTRTGYPAGLARKVKRTTVVLIRKLGRAEYQ